MLKLQINSSSSNESSFNIDDLVKKIDAKIADIEREEAAQKENTSADVNKSDTSLNDLISDNNDSNNNVVIINDVKNNSDNDSNKVTTVYEDNTDDAFFDDFFSDDD